MRPTSTQPANPFRAPNASPNASLAVMPGFGFDDFARDCFDWAPILPHDQGAYTVLSLSGTGERYVLTPKRGPQGSCLCSCPAHARARAKARALPQGSPVATNAPHVASAPHVAECKHAALATLAPAFLARLRDLWAKGHTPSSARALWQKRLALYQGKPAAQTLAALQDLRDGKRPTAS